MNRVLLKRPYPYNLLQSSFFSKQHNSSFQTWESKLFLGKYLCALDGESRFLAPYRFRKYITDEVYITKGFDHNLWVFSGEAFQEIYKKLGQFNIADPLARLLFRLLLGAATESGISEQGFVKIPEDLKGYANIEAEVFLIGQGHYFEIWSPGSWDQQEAELEKTESNTERFSTFQITLR